mmetsp:Transcript_17989/g.63200  ORF Transcript_17989/g.63200 Transcript_17989/m.63200 type:complete len:319 (-) Transcript_17989:198-1154(-)
MLQSLQRDRLAPLLGGQGVIATAVAAHANFGTCTSTSQSLQSDVVPDCPAQPVQTMSNGTKHSLFNGIPSEYWYHGGIATADTAQAVFSTGACTSPSLQRDQLAAGLGGQGDIGVSDGGQAPGGTGASMSQMRSITACGSNLGRAASCGGTAQRAQRVGRRACEVRKQVRELEAAVLGGMVCTSQTLCIDALCVGPEVEQQGCVGATPLLAHLHRGEDGDGAAGAEHGDPSREHLRHLELARGDHNRRRLCPHPGDQVHGGPTLAADGIRIGAALQQNAEDLWGASVADGSDDWRQLAARHGPGGGLGLLHESPAYGL